MREEENKKVKILKVKVEDGGPSGQKSEIRGQS